LMEKNVPALRPCARGDDFGIFAGVAFNRHASLGSPGRRMP
jgi:hypothetical protein